MPVPYSALLISDDISEEGEFAFPFDISDANTLQTVEAIIQGVTGIMEGAAGLNRNLIVREYTHYFRYHDWDYDPARQLYFVHAPQWPVVEIDTSGFTIGDSQHSWQGENDLILYTSRFSGAINYYAGYKRAEQILTDLQTPLPDLGTLPPDLPYDIRSKAINAVLKEFAERRQGPGQRSRTMNPAIQTTTVQEVIHDYIRRVCRLDINHHRKLA